MRAHLRTCVSLQQAPLFYRTNHDKDCHERKKLKMADVPDALVAERRS
jgi:hypothetical protein